MDMKVPKTCEVACVVKMKKSDKDAFVRAIDDEYRVHWTVDNLPVGTVYNRIVWLTPHTFCREIVVLIIAWETSEKHSVMVYLFVFFQHSSVSSEMCGTE